MRGFSRRVGRFLTLAAAALSLGAMSAVAQTAPTAPAIRSTDYAADRAQFQTRLLYKGPSPQDYEPVTPPKGVSVVTYPSGNLSLKAWVKLPDKAPEHAPVVVFLHGGFAFGAEDFEMAEPFRKAGFAIVVPILRGENGQAGQYSMLYDEVGDAIAAAEFVSKQSYADPARIYLAGHSVGGTIAMLSGMASSKFKAVASFSGSPDQVKWTGGSNAGIVPFDKSNPREYEMRSPISYPASFKSPTRIYYGSQEGFFRDTTKRLVELARAAGRDVEMKEFPGDHFSAVPAEIAEAIAFFKAHP
jgi:dipeptidyl aminopeptidase/acylaminoacyl peptidase